MRPGLSGDGGVGPGAPHRPAHLAPALFAVEQGRDAGRPGAHGRRAAAAVAGAAGRPGRAAAAADAVHPALGPEPLRRAGGLPARRGGDPRPRARPATAQARRALAPLHRRRARTAARARLHAGGGAATCAAVAAAGAGQRPAAVAGADPGAGAGAGAVPAAEPVLHAVGGGRRGGQRRPRPAVHAGPGLRAARAGAGGHGRGAVVGGAGAVGHAEPAMAGERVRTPAAAAGGLVREAPCRRHLVALRRRAADPEDADHELHRGRARRCTGAADAGDDGLVQPAAHRAGAAGGGGLRPAALGVLPAAARGHRGGAGVRGQAGQPLPRVAARRAGDQAVQCAGRPAVALFQPGGRRDERRHQHAQAGAAVRGAAPAAVRARARGRHRRRRAAGAGQQAQRRHAVRVLRLQGAVRAAGQRADRQGGGAEDAEAAGRAAGRHRAHPARDRRRSGRRHHARVAGQPGTARRALPLRRRRARGAARGQPAHRAWRVGGHRGSVGLRQDHAAEADAGHPGTEQR